MRAFILFDLKNRVEVNAAILASAEMLSPAPAGHVWAEVPMPLEEHTVDLVDGEIVVIDRPEQPDRQLTYAKATQRQTINLYRNSVEFGSFEWDGSRFDADEKSQARLQGAFQLANLAQFSNQPFNIDWTLADNSVRTLSATDMNGVGQALAAHILAVHIKARALKAAIDAAATVDEVEAVTW